MYTKDCYILGEKEPVFSLPTKRTNAASIMISPSTLWISGNAATFIKIDANKTSRFQVAEIQII